jgi:hypothetical protein
MSVGKLQRNDRVPPILLDRPGGARVRRLHAIHAQSAGC